MSAFTGGRIKIISMIEINRNCKMGKIKLNLFFVTHADGGMQSWNIQSRLHAITSLYHFLSGISERSSANSEMVILLDGACLPVSGCYKYIYCIICINKCVLLS